MQAAENAAPKAKITSQLVPKSIAKTPSHAINGKISL